MATPALADDMVVKSSNSDPANEEQAVQEGLLQDDLMQEEEGPAHFPLSTQEQLQAMARRREAAVSFKNQVSECRLALRYSVIGWTGTLDPVSRRRLFSPPPPSYSPTEYHLSPPAHPPTYQVTQFANHKRRRLTQTNHAQEKIPTALSNAPSIRDLDAQMDRLERKLAPFLPAENNSNNREGQGQGLGAEALARVERVRAALLEVEPGVKSTRFIKPVLDEVERGARASGILPPQDNAGWVWSLSFDDWFIWRAGEGAFVSARHGVRTDFVAA